MNPGIEYEIYTLGWERHNKLTLGKRIVQLEFLENFFFIRTLCNAIQFTSWRPIKLEIRLEV